MEKHKLIALAIFLLVSLYIGIRDGFEEAIAQQVVLAVLLLPIVFYRWIAFFSGFGFPEYFARDFKSENNPGPYALFFWLIFLIACLIIIFEWSLY